MVGVVVGEDGGHVDSLRAQRRHRFAVAVAARGVGRAVRAVAAAAGGVGRAVRAVAADGEDRCVLDAVKQRRRRERYFLVAPAEAVPREVDDGLSARDVGERFFRVFVRARYRAASRAVQESSAVRTTGS